LLLRNTWKEWSTDILQIMFVLVVLDTCDVSVVRVPVNWITYYSCTIRPILISTFNFKFIISFIFNLDIWFHWMCRWTKSNWAFLNEPPVMEAPTNKYASQFHIANLGSTKTNTGQHGISAWLIGIVLSNSTFYIHVM
jgi:hypothetical protein